MLDIDRELKALSQKKEYPDDALRETTCVLLRQEYLNAQRTARSTVTARRAVRWAAVFTAAVAIMLAIVLTLFPAETAMAAGYYTVDISSADISPSVVLSVDSDDIVLTAAAGNSDAEVLLDGLSLAGLSIDDALGSIVRVASETGSLMNSDHILVAHFGDTLGLTTQQASEIVSNATASAVNVLVLQGDKQYFKTIEKKQKNAGIELLKENAAALGIDTSTDTDTIIGEVQSKQGKENAKPSPTTNHAETPSPSVKNDNKNDGGQDDGNAQPPPKSDTSDDSGNNGSSGNKSGDAEASSDTGKDKSQSSQKPAPSNGSGSKKDQHSD